MRRVSLVGFALVLLVIGAGCLGTGGAPDRSDSAERKLAALNSSIQDTSTYQVRTDLRATAVADGEQLSREATIVGVVNATQKRSKTTLSMAGENRTVYRDNRTIYRECESPWGWANETVGAEGPWIQQTTLSRHAELLQSGDLRVEQTDRLAGENAVALVGEPTSEALQKYREEGTRSVVGGSKIENVTVRLVLDNETDRPLRGSMSFEVRQDGVTATVSMDTQFSNYDDPVRITIPEKVTDGTVEWSGGCPGS